MYDFNLWSKDILKKEVKKRFYYDTWVVDVAMSLKVVAKTPSLHSCVVASKHPYNWAIVMDFGLMMVDIT